MSIISLIIFILIIGLIVWLIETLTPIDPTFKRVIRGIAFVFVLIYILYAIFGLGPTLQLRFP
jgi:hypothetical protein